MHYFDLVYAGMTSVVGVMGCVLLSDTDGMFSYKDRGMLKVGALHGSAARYHPTSKRLTTTPACSPMPWL